MKIILASQSPRRQELLRQMGVRFRVVTEEVEEIHGYGRAAHAICKHNALAKAKAVGTRFPRETVLGADTLVHLGEELLGKPASLAEARRMLGRLSGEVHQVTTACALVCGERRKVFSVTTRVSFRELSPKQINAYLRAVPVLDKAGAYAIQEKGEWIVEAIHGSLTNVVGLPMGRLRTELAAWFDSPAGRP